MAVDAKYNEAILYPRFTKSLDNLVYKYDTLFTEHHIQTNRELLALIEKADFEGNGVIVQHEYCGYLVLVWKEHLSFNY